MALTSTLGPVVRAGAPAVEDIVPRAAAAESSVEQKDENLKQAVAQIDTLLRQSWEAAGVTAAPVCSDQAFVRRLHLDLTGRIPTLPERQAFLNDGRMDKRARLIETLLASEDYVQHLADMLDALLMGRVSERGYAERVKHGWRAWLERGVRENRPWNDIAADILRARPESHQDRGAVWFLYERRDDYQKIAEAVAPAFFGIRIDCAQCHDHMLAAEIEQQHYWGLVAFFARGKNVESANGPRVSESAVGGFSEFADLEGSSRPNLLTFLEAPTIEEPRPDTDQPAEDADRLYRPAALEGDPRVPVFSRREQFVSEVVQSHPLLARAFVNRMWAMLLGRGIVHPFSEMDSVHPPSHPELLDWLAEDFRDSGYNVRRLVQLLVLSQPYQLQSRRPEGVEDPATFAWSLERPLTAEQLARSMQVAVRGEFRNDHPLTGAIREKMPDVMPEQALTTVRDALFLTNNSVVNEFLAEAHQENGLVWKLSRLSTSDERIELLFAALFGRSATPEEAEAVTDFLEASTTSAAEADKRLHERLRHVLWALLTSAEFRLNH